MKANCSATKKGHSKDEILAEESRPLGKYFTFGAVFVIVMGIAGAVIGAAAFGYLFKLWPLEASITAALCSCDVGGSGDIAILSASNRMQLLPFSSISTRIGGALMILKISFLMPLFL